MTITPTIIYINVNVIIVVQSDAKANKGDITSNILYGGTGVASYNSYDSYISTTFS